EAPPPSSLSPAWHGPSGRVTDLGPEPLLEQAVRRGLYAEDLFLEDARHPGDGADRRQDWVSVDDLPVFDELVVADAEEVRGGGPDLRSGRRDAGVVSRVRGG